MLDGQRCKMRVGDEICPAFRACDKGCQYLLVTLRRKRNPDGLLGEPRLRLPPCGGYRSRSVEYARITDEPNES